MSILSRIGSQPGIYLDEGNGALEQTVNHQPKERRDKVMAKGNKVVRITADQHLISGILKHLDTRGRVIDGQQYSRAEMVRELEGRVEVTTKVTASKAQWQADVRAEKTRIQATKRFVSGLRQTLLAMFGSSVDVLADFGLAPRRSQRELTAVEKVQRAARAKATRAARHTMGKRDTAKVKGTHEVTVIVATGTQPAEAASGEGHAPAPPATGAPKEATTGGSVS